MPCEFCGLESVFIKRHEGTGEAMLWDRQGERPHNCPIPTIFCPTCNKRMLQTDPCAHYKALGYKPGENEAFFIRLIKFPPQPRQNKKWIGTSVGNTRTKDTKCKRCGQDLNHKTYEQIQVHIKEHEKTDVPSGQGRLF